jgi:hypothetical protein
VLNRTPQSLNGYGIAKMHRQLAICPRDRDYFCDTVEPSIILAARVKASSALQTCPSLLCTDGQPIVRLAVGL